MAARSEYFYSLGKLYFYGWWDWRFLALIAFSTVVDFLLAIRIKNSSVSKRKLWLAVSILTNLGLLGFFKYYNFLLKIGLKLGMY